MRETWATTVDVPRRRSIPSKLPREQAAVLAGFLGAARGVGLDVEKGAGDAHGMGGGEGTVDVRGEDVLESLLSARGEDARLLLGLGVVLGAATLGAPAADAAHPARAHDAEHDLGALGVRGVLHVGADLHPGGHLEEACVCVEENGVCVWKES